MIEKEAVQVVESKEQTAVYILKGLNCAHCAAKIEKEVGQLNGIDSAAINLVKQTLTVTGERAALVKGKITKIVHSHEPKVTVTDNSAQASQKEKGATVMLIRIIVGCVIFGVAAILHFTDAALPLQLGFVLVAYLILGYDVVAKALRNIIKGRVFDENFLMSVSTVGALVIGEYLEAVAVMLLYQIGEFFQGYAVNRSRKSIAGLMNLRPDEVTVLRDGVERAVAPEEVAVGELIVVKPGERIPLDGVVQSGVSQLDTRALTGETLPRDAKRGDEALSGCVNMSGKLTLKVSKPSSESTVAKIIDLVENASSKKAAAENFITKFARYYTPAVVILATLLAVLPPLFFDASWTEWVHRGLVFLVVSCPCALVISVPLTYFGGIGAASRRGVLVKGGNYLDALSGVTTFVFDKTGTLTKGEFRVRQIIPNGVTDDQLLLVAAKAERFSNHPIARSIVARCGVEAVNSCEGECEEIAGRGVNATVDGAKVLVGNEKLMRENGVEIVPCEQAGTKVYVAQDGSFLGCILIADELKEDSVEAVCAIKSSGKKTVMLTGDHSLIAKSVADELGLDEFYAELLPAQKAEKLEQIALNSQGKLAFVGDGINDAPVLARADVGIAMGGLGSDAAIEAADVVLMTDEPSKINDALKIAKKTRRIVLQNIVFALGVKAAILILGAFGIAGMWEAVFGDVGVAFLAILNALRIFKK